MKIAVFYRVDFEDTRARLSLEAEKMGLSLTWVKYRELKLVNKNIFWGETDIRDFDGWYFRAVGNELEWSKLLQFYARENKIPVVDDYLLTEGPLRRFKSVMGWQLLKANIKYPKTSYVDSLTDLEKELANWEFPLIVKLSQGGRHGMGTFFLKEMADLNHLKERLLSRKEKSIMDGKKVGTQRGFLIQEYIRNDGDFRVMTVGYKCIGGFKRQMKEEKLVLNKSVGSSKPIKDMPADVLETAQKAAKVLGVEVAGTDLVRDAKTGEIYIVEVNEAPQFKVFESRTKVNVARKILEHCVEKFSK